VTGLAVPARRFSWAIPAILSQFTLKCAPQPKIAKKKHKTPYFGGSKSFKIISVNTAKKLITSACYDKQHAYAYLQLFSR